jgi:ribonuclease Z
MRFSITVLGSGAAIPLSHRNPSAHLVNVHEQYYLFDCAEGTQVQLRRNRLRLQKVSNIFISHLHGDHYFGLIGLITSLHLLGREKELNLYAHPDLEKIISLQLESSQTVLRYPLNFHPVDPGSSELIMENKFVSVTTIPMNHDFPACGFLIREKEAKPNIRKDFIEGRDLSNTDFRSIKNGNDYVDKDGHLYKNADITSPPRRPRSYAYCTDTAYYERIIPLVEGVDLLYHEATFMEDRLKDAAAKFHSTAKQAATIASKAGVRQLMLGHYSARYKELDPLLLEAKEVFSDTILAEDGLTIEL